MGELNSDVYIRDPHMLWQNGIIPYEFNNKVINNLRQYVEIAMKEISKVSSIRFVKRTDQLHFIEIVDKGKQGGKQELSVTTGWQNPVGSAIHKLLHSCGMFHEHSCPVRDKYVVVRRNGDCNYKKLKSSNVKRYSKYDFESIMHYPLTLCMDVKPGVKKPNSKIGFYFYFCLSTHRRSKEKKRIISIKVIVIFHI
ncbi:uncharacterized protein OCT59_003303 [Rhizophagus irregularis]|uniref:uncharacterized protein n=1 Tax=Rhizophagus irregularis TaxID=588596 RepID=UPI00331D951F|nr:hypothetical protein OCT59_003303 [Rhizophagus irregularis]